MSTPCQENGTIMDGFVSQLFNKAHQAGLQKCQTYMVSGVELSADTDDHEVISEVAALSFEAELDGKSISTYTENFSADSIEFLIRSCLESASILDKGSSRQIYNGNGKYPPLSLPHDKAGDIETIRNLVMQMRTEIDASGDDLKRSSGYVQSLLRTIRVINDNGIDVSTPHSYTFAVVNPIYSHADVMKTSQFFRCGGRPADLDIPAQVKTATQMVKQYFDASAINSGSYPVVFYNEAASHMLQSMGILFCKDLVDAGRSRFKGKLGHTVAADIVTILDDPYQPDGLFSMPFDAQGVPTLQRTLIEKGQLKDFFCDLNTAEPKLGLHPGSLTRSRVNLTAEISATNMFIQPGSNTQEALLSSLGNGLFITEVSDYFPGHGLNLASGDFSLPCKGFLVTNGQIEKAFDNVTAAGNLYQFLQQIEMLGNELATGLPVNLIPGMPFRAGSYASPALLVRDIHIAGK